MGISVCFAESLFLQLRWQNPEQYFNKLEDPRTLPCLHVYCMRCLKTDIGGRKDHIRCAYCR